MHAENPYQAPLLQIDAQPPFRAFWSESWFSWFARGCDISFSKRQDSATLVLRDLFVLTFGWALIAFGSVLCVAGLIRSLSAPEWYAPLCSSAIFLLSGGFALMSRERVVLSPDSIQTAGPFLNRRQMRWSETVALTFTKTGIIKLKRVDGSQVRILPMLVGVCAVPEILQRQLPRDVFEENEENLREYARFLGVRC